MKMEKYIKNRGFTDKLYTINFIMTWIFVWGCFIASLFSGKLGITDLSPMTTAISCCFGELGIHTGFVVHKARVENLAKHNKLQDAMINVE